MAIRTRDDQTGLDDLDPAKIPTRDAVHFRRSSTARRALGAAEQELRDAVRAARKAGDSWTVIGAALDTTRQAAQQRCGGESTLFARHESAVALNAAGAVVR